MSVDIVARGLAAQATAGKLDTALAARGVAFQKGKLAKFSAAVTRVRNRTGRARLAFVGSSVTAGWGSGVAVGNGGGANPSTGGNAIRSRGVVAMIAQQLILAGIPCRADALFGNNSFSAITSADYILYNPQVTLGADWALGGNGRYFTGATTGTTSMTFAPLLPADTFEIGYRRDTGYGDFTVSDASGVLGTYTSTGSNTRQMITVTRAVASTLPISIQRTGTGGAIIVQSIMPYSVASPMVELWNMGCGGATSANWVDATGALPFFNAITALAPDMCILNIGPNDANTGVATATYQANLQALITQCALVGDVGLAKSNKTTVGGGTGFDLPASYLAALDALMIANGLTTMLDFNALPLVTGDWFDAIHLSAQGYAKEAVYAAPVLLAQI